MMNAKPFATFEELGDCASGMANVSAMANVTDEAAAAVANSTLIAMEEERALKGCPDRA